MKSKDKHPAYSGKPDVKAPRDLSTKTETVKPSTDKNYEEFRRKPKDIDEERHPEEQIVKSKEEFKPKR